MSERTIPILGLDDQVVAVAKPPGLIVHRTALTGDDEDNLVDRLQQQLGRRVWTVHRLDRPTSGVMLFALTADAAAALGRAFEAREVRKSYLAVVRGWPPADGIIDHPVKDRDQPRKPARRGVTAYRSVATVELPVEIETWPTSRLALVELEPKTGRRHQLRRHMKHLGHPIIGDTSFGRGAWNRYFRERYGVHRLLLHAWRIAFTHPGSGAPAAFVQPPTDDFAKLLEEFDWPECRDGEA